MYWYSNRTRAKISNKREFNARETIMLPLDDVLLSNKAWAEDVKKTNPDFFQNLAKQQAPQYLWIGCADSRVPANQIIGKQPGEVFVHRNIANLVIHTDLNCLSVMQYAVDILKVNHIIVCGHYGCGGIKAALDSQQHGLIDNWLRHIKDVYRYYQDQLDVITDEKAKNDKLCELNVVEQVANVSHTTIVQNAWKSGHDLTVHGLVYSIEDGVLHNLDICVNNSDNLSSTHKLT